ncbi:hypothetical protein SDC9_130240 [bioreactor metagenome]|uniref:Uncharacterized protein n=1 Tax=bioreactor metagenome TaxID=1076179 RepID=A0A645D1Z9_9ZZZZ
MPGQVQLSPMNIGNMLTDPVEILLRSLERETWKPLQVLQSQHRLDQVTIWASASISISKGIEQSLNIPELLSIYMPALIQLLGTNLTVVSITHVRKNACAILALPPEIGEGEGITLRIGTKQLLGAEAFHPCLDKQLRKACRKPEGVRKPAEGCDAAGLLCKPLLALDQLLGKAFGIGKVRVAFHPESTLCDDAFFANQIHDFAVNRRVMGFQQFNQRGLAE